MKGMTESVRARNLKRQMLMKSERFAIRPNIKIQQNSVCNSQWFLSVYGITMVIVISFGLYVMRISKVADKLDSINLNRFY